MAVFESFPDSVLLRILLSVLLHIVSFSWSCYVLYPSLSLVTYRILLSTLLHIVSLSQSCYILYHFLSLVTYHIFLSVLLHTVSFSQSCYILYDFLSLVTHHILLSVLLHIVSISSLGFIFLCCMKEWPVKQTKNHGFFQMRRISSASCARHLRVTTCLVIFIIGSTSSSATSSVGRRPGRLTMVNTSSVLRHLISWSRGISLVLHHFMDHWTPH